MGCSSIGTTEHINRGGGGVGPCEPSFTFMGMLADKISSTVQITTFIDLTTSSSSSHHGLVWPVDKIIGSYVFDKTVTSESYLIMLRGLLIPADLDNFRLRPQWFMQEGASPHYCLQVCH